MSVPVNLEPEGHPLLWPAITVGPAYLASRRPNTPGPPAVKLSILMCAYNEERTIARAISEVLAADYPCDMELIVVDDGSTDATSALLGHVNDPRVIIHRHPVTRARARHCGQLLPLPAVRTSCRSMRTSNTHPMASCASSSPC